MLRRVHCEIHVQVLLPVMDTEVHIREHLEHTDLCTVISKGGFVQRCVGKVNTLDLRVLNAIHL